MKKSSSDLLASTDLGEGPVLTSRLQIKPSRLRQARDRRRKVLRRLRGSG
ncbi:MAG TPA: hypothetical protein VF345_03215 [Chthoniobacterales bacterium]